MKLVYFGIIRTKGNKQASSDQDTDFTQIYYLYKFVACGFTTGFTEQFYYTVKLQIQLISAASTSYAECERLDPEEVFTSKFANKAFEMSLSVDIQGVN